ncbi:MAG: hypothetical protein K8T91_09000 [Planctomycetes bacterium]|nr:hypothetical protein [Planctomycetota bacterium]
MKTRLLIVASLVLVSASTALAQPPALPQASPPATPAPRTSDVSLSDVKATPEMWFYLQERQRYDSPKLAVRRNAEMDATQRNQRLAAQKWLGQSPERPNVYSTIFGGHYPGTFPYGNADRWNSYFTLGSSSPRQSSR